MNDVNGPPSHGAAVTRRLARLRTVLEGWGPTEGRTYPWRQCHDPYLRLIAEVLLQRTRADAVAQTWPRFVHTFRTPECLAAASEEEIALAVAPLGLARKRAGYLKDLGRSLTEIGTIPTDTAALVALPGVGPYSAAAFLTSWRGTRTAPVDANIRRVIGRAVLGIDVAHRRETEILVGRLLARGEATTILHALLDFGASPCRPRHPQCEGCPARSFCLFWQRTAASGPGPETRTPLPG